MPEPNRSPQIRAEIRLADAALQLLDRTSWSELTLAAVLRAAKLSWADVSEIAPSKSTLVRGLLRHVFDAAARTYRPDRASHSPRERLFDVCMAWFDAQQKLRKSLSALYSGLRADPLLLLSARQAILETTERLLALAEADTGPLSPARALCLSGILARATAAWLEDDEDLSRTMAKLDSDLRRAEPFLWPKQSRNKPGRKN